MVCCAGDAARCQGASAAPTGATSLRHCPGRSRQPSARGWPAAGLRSISIQVYEATAPIPDGANQPIALLSGALTSYRFDASLPAGPVVVLPPPRAAPIPHVRHSVRKSARQSQAQRRRFAAAGDHASDYRASAADEPDCQIPAWPTRSASRWTA
jgi:hypothetical protein